MSRSTLLLLTALFMLGCRPDAPPNVVLIVIDDLGWKDTGVYGSSFYRTPHIDQLASAGTRFSQFYAASPVCSPTRASLMTGKNPARVRITNWIGGEQRGLLRQVEYRRQLPLEEMTIAEAFSQAGYETGYIGKWHLGRQGFMPKDQGFGWSFAVNEAGQPGSYFPPYENPNWAVTNVPDLAAPSDEPYLPDRLSAAAADFIRARGERPFFLVLSHYTVHTPLQAPQELIEAYEAAADSVRPAYRAERDSDTRLHQSHATYAAMIERMDASVGRVMSALRGEGLSENTIVVFVSDNGGLSTLVRRGFNQATSNEPLRAGKGWLYEGGIRIPLIMRGPGIPAGLVVDAPASTVDLYPTLLEAAGIELNPGQHQDGASMVPLLTGQPADRAIYWHFPHYHGSGMRPAGGMRQGDLKLIEWFEDGALELYDLARDPSETRNLVEQQADDAARLQQALSAWRARVGANMPVADGG